MAFRDRCRALCLTLALFVPARSADAGWIPPADRTLDRWDAHISLGLAPSMFSADASRALRKSAYGEDVVVCQGVWPLVICTTETEYPEERSPFPAAVSLSSNLRLTQNTSGGVLLGFPVGVGNVWGRDANGRTIQMEGGLSTLAFLYGYDDRFRLRAGPAIYRTKLELQGGSREQFEETRFGAVVEYGIGWLRQPTRFGFIVQVRGVLGSGFDRVDTSGGTGTLDLSRLGFSSMVLGVHVGVGQ